MKEISADLVKAQKEFGPALKTHTNPAFRSKYANLSACVEAVVDALNNNNIFLMQPTHPCDDGVIVETVFIHSSGEQISSGKLQLVEERFHNQPPRIGESTGWVMLWKCLRTRLSIIFDLIQPRRAGTPL